MGWFDVLSRKKASGLQLPKPEEVARAAEAAASEMVGLERVDPVAEAEVYRAYGRDSQALEILLIGLWDNRDEKERIGREIALHHPGFPLSAALAVVEMEEKRGIAQGELACRAQSERVCSALELIGGVYRGEVSASEARFALGSFSEALDAAPGQGSAAEAASKRASGLPEAQAAPEGLEFRMVQAGLDMLAAKYPGNPKLAAAQKALAEALDLQLQRQAASESSRPGRPKC